ncbi:hypothetical protein [Microbacterium aquimaris]|uniref:Secreted protein n=1 Tax=Microbacterium aquimaris TaxID=459816 RepID=A0ABU5N2Z3_9MICO|nr:hypothetical protein [Microbacterium aquimaris]MDZ8160463.1 hypothetical protein [Microbacterium aquimaris]
MLHPRHVIATLALAASSVLIAGCASGATPHSTPDPLASSDTAGSVEAEVEAAWLDDGSAIGILTYGSSTCLPTVGDSGYADGVLTVELVDSDDVACTRDFVPRGVYVPLPEEVDPTADLDVVVTGSSSGQAEVAGDADLGGKGGGLVEGAPSAGWAGDDVVLLLTWGSSTCPPLIGGAVATSPTEVTVTIEPLPAEQPCTADFGPRVSVVAVEGLGDDDGGERIEAVLDGDPFDALRIPIAGSR